MATRHDLNGSDVALLECSVCGGLNGHTATLTELYKAAKAKPGNPGSVAISGRTEEDQLICPDYIENRPCEGCEEEGEG